eukprot:m.42261 g.42261  ORF g.42261 m.42261 type:complete len:429 (-) comp15017_c0_seq3:57-1343(-)
MGHSAEQERAIAALKAWRVYLSTKTHKIWHPYTPSTIAAAYICSRNIFLTGIRIYGSLGLFAHVARRKSWQKLLTEYVPNTLRSAAFLGAYGLVSFGGVAGLHRLLRTSAIFRHTVFYKLYYGVDGFGLGVFLPVLIAGLTSFIERADRVPELAVFMMQQSMLTLWTLLKEQCKWVRPIPHADTILFCGSLAVLLHQLHHAIARRVAGFIGALLQMLYRPQLNSEEPRQQKVDRWQLCQEDFVRGFALGWGPSTALLLMSALSKRSITAVGHTLSVVLSSTSLRPGLLCASAVSIFRPLQAKLREMVGDTLAAHGAHTAMAGFLSGLPFAALQGDKSARATYFFAKTIEAVFSALCSKKLLSPLPHGEYILFAFASAIPIHLATVQPHVVPSSYWRFLNQITLNNYAKVDRSYFEAMEFADATKLFRS